MCFISRSGVMPSLDVSQHRTSLEGQPQRVSCLSPLPLRRRHSKNESLGPVAELGLHSSVFCCWDKERNHRDMGESMYFCLYFQVPVSHGIQAGTRSRSHGRLLFADSLTGFYLVRFLFFFSHAIFYLNFF